MNELKKVMEKENGENNRTNISFRNSNREKM